MVYVSIAHGIYYLLTGVWALVSIDTFQKVTGPKTDLWLVKTIGWLVSVIGLVLILAGIRGEVGAEIVLLAIGNAIALAGVDVYYVSKGTISKVYLIDAIGEAILIIWWILSWLGGGLQST